MNLDHFEQAARSAFRFLEEDYGFELASTQSDYRARYLTYTSDAAFVSLGAESLGSSFTVTLGAAARQGSCGTSVFGGQRR